MTHICKAAVFCPLRRGRPDITDDNSLVSKSSAIWRLMLSWNECPDDDGGLNSSVQECLGVPGYSGEGGGERE